MSRSIRPWATTGVAIVGAGVLAVAPLEPAQHTDIRIANAAVELTAAPNPFEYYPQVLMRSLANTGDRLDEYFADPFPIVGAIAENQLEAVDSIVGAAVDREPVAVVRAIVDAVVQPAVNLARVLGSGEPFQTAAGFLARLALPVVSGVFAAGAAAGDVVEALIELDLVGAINAAINIPARIIDGFLNGVVDGETHAYYGLLDPVFEAPVVDQLTGPVAFLIASLQEIGETISSPSPADRVPDLAAPAMTLSVGPGQPAAQDELPPETAAGDPAPGGTTNPGSATTEPAQAESGAATARDEETEDARSNDAAEVDSEGALAESASVAEAAAADDDADDDADNDDDDDDTASADDEPASSSGAPE